MNDIYMTPQEMMNYRIAKLQQEIKYLEEKYNNISYEKNKTFEQLESAQDTLALFEDFLNANS